MGRDCLLAGLLVLVVCVAVPPAKVIAQLNSPLDPICRLRTKSDGMIMSGPLEYDVKAAILYRCLELVHWPSNTAAEEPILKMGLLGKNPFGESLNSIEGKTVSGRKLTVKKVSSAKAARNCDLVFICSSETKRTSKILNELAGLPVLTVGEVPRFADDGGIINLLLDGKNIRLEINLGAAERARIGFDPKLLKIIPWMSDPTSPATNSASS